MILHSLKLYDYERGCTEKEQNERKMKARFQDLVKTIKSLCILSKETMKKKEVARKYFSDNL
ncbi:MAG: hypothetical protein JXR52_05935 [Bacteroidales bacterium]|nr:hypothetical protein [Bacteroidales bacterium]MBN2698348.1 hypothetical protein [Bacteroidales bacterium]